MTTISLKCQCGEVTGIAKNISPKYGTRLVCHCSDCQAFAVHLGTDDRTLDAYGGTDIYQTNPAQLSFESGKQHLKCLRLTPKGTIRWYASCCNTPIGNTSGAKLPFVGLIHTIMSETWIDAAGPIQQRVQTQDALPGLAHELQNPGFSKPMIHKAIRKILWWKIMGKGQPNPFFSKDGSPISKPIIVKPD